jgi:hypothetical protein
MKINKERNKKEKEKNTSQSGVGNGVDVGKGCRQKSGTNTSLAFVHVSPHTIHCLNKQSTLSAQLVLSLPFLD